MMAFSQKMRLAKTHLLMTLSLCYLETCGSLESSSCVATFWLKVQNLKVLFLFIVLDLTSGIQFPHNDRCRTNEFAPMTEIAVEGRVLGCFCLKHNMVRLSHTDFIFDCT